ncbi:MAG TPA: hypothetical protein VGV92_07615 [Gammaproteobacteria bacterium]|nr:hypothetical protein [Gammaproteobacteria bacterium]
MRNLSEVLAQKAKVISLAQRFGFSDEVRISCEQPFKGPSTTLTLIVKEIEGITLSYKNSSWLSAKLSETLGCQVGITVLDSIEQLDRYGVLKTSALITDDEATICTLLGVASSDKVMLNNVDPEFHDAVLEEAEAYLKKTSPVGIKKLSNAQAVSIHGFLPDSSSGSGEERELKKAKPESSASSSPDNTVSPLKNTEGFTKK